MTAQVFSRPTEKKLVFLSHRNGIPNIYKSNTTNRINAQATQLTDIAGAIFPWDWSGSKDSILVTSFDSRNSVGLYWMPANREVKSAPTIALKNKYSDWRTIHFPLITRVYDSMPPVAINDLGYYNSLAHIRPLFIVPVLASDKAADGTLGTRCGLFGTAFDPMEKHIMNAFLDYGDVSNEFGGFLKLYEQSALSEYHGDRFAYLWLCKNACGQGACMSVMRAAR